MKSIKELSCKLAKAELKNQMLRIKIEHLRVKVKSLEKSRSGWKGKSISKGKQINGLKRALGQSDYFGVRPCRHQYQTGLICLCVHLRLLAGCSYRSVVKIIQIVCLRFSLQIGSIPCANTVENWVRKLGFYELEHRWGQDLKGPLCIIVDESMRVGPYKQLLVLGMQAHKTNGESPDFCSVRILHMSISKRYTGEIIGEVLLNIAKRSGQKILYGISDDDSKIKKAFRLSGITRVSDVSHAIGRCLEKAFKQEQGYCALSKAISHWQYTGVNRSYAYLLPPKQRVQARFMNMDPMVKWGKEMLGRFEHLSTEQQSAFSELKTHQSTLQNLEKALCLGQSISLLLKKEGLCTENIAACLQILQSDHFASQPVNVFKQALSNYLNNLNPLLQHHKRRWHCSSEVIESMFGKRKAKDADNPLVQSGINVMEMPLYCLKAGQIEDNICPALEHVSLPQITSWAKTQFTENQSYKRNQFFKKQVQLLHN